MICEERYRSERTGLSNDSVRHSQSIRQAALWLAVSASLVMTWSSAAALQGRRHRIGVLEPAAAKNVSDRLVAFKRGPREFDYIEARILREYRYWEENPERLPDLAAELVNVKSISLLRHRRPAYLPEKATIPIVSFFSAFRWKMGSPCASRIKVACDRIDSSERKLNGKRLELLADTFPGITRVGMLFNPSNPTQP